MPEQGEGMRVFISSCLLVVTALAFSMAGVAQDKAPKVAILNIQAAIAQCNEGQEAAKALRDKFAPKRDELEKAQREINDLQNQLKNQEKTLSEEARARLMRTMDDKTRAFNRSNEDATAEFQQAEQDAINEIGRKVLGVISEHAKQNGYTIVLDVSSPQTPVLYADSAIDITEKIIELYNASTKRSSSTTEPAQPRPSAVAPAAPKPAAAAPARPAAPKPATTP
jgi:outer membrane protein